MYHISSLYLFSIKLCFRIGKQIIVEWLLGLESKSLPCNVIRINFYLSRSCNEKCNENFELSKVPRQEYLKFPEFVWAHDKLKVPDLTMANQGWHVTQVLETVMERLQDFEDKVRSRAIVAICEAAIANPEVSYRGFACRRHAAYAFDSCKRHAAYAFDSCNIMQHMF